MASISIHEVAQQAARDLLEPPIPTINLIVAQELHELALRREAHRRAQENR